MKYLLDFLAVQTTEKSGVPPARVPTKPTKPPLRGENPGECPEQGTDKTDETPRSAEPTDWPESWAVDFRDMVDENIRLGHPPGEASRLAFLVLEARAAAPWRAVVAAWSIDRRQRWGDRAGALQDAGTGWREAERIAFGEITTTSGTDRGTTQ
jgi:hypothetical protein